MEFRLQDVAFDHPFYVLNEVSYWTLLGTDFLSPNRCKIDYDSHSFMVNSVIPQLMSLRLTKEPFLGAVDYFQGYNNNQSKYQQKCDRILPIAYDQSLDMVSEKFDDVPNHPHDLAYYSKIFPQNLVRKHKIWSHYPWTYPLPFYLKPSKITKEIT